MIRHAGHADVLREQLDCAVAFGPQPSKDAAFWANRCAEIERAARAAQPETR